MRVGVDAKVLEPPRAGMARYLEGLLVGLEAVSAPGLEIELVRPVRRRRTLPWVLWDLQRATARGFDVFHFPFYYPPLVPRCPSTVAVHDILVIEHPEWFVPRIGNTLRAMIPVGLRRADGVLTGSEHTAAAIADRFGVPRRRIRVIRYGLDRTVFRPPAAREIRTVRSRLGLERPYVLQVGALEPRRGIDLSVAATAALRMTWRDLELVLAGDPRTRVEGLEVLPPWVRRLGRVEETQLPALFTGAAAVLAPSRGEGFDLPVLEALGCGAVVAASDIPAHVEHFGPAVELFPSGDAAALAATLHGLLDDSARADVLRRRAVAHASAFTWEETASVHLELWREVAGR